MKRLAMLLRGLFRRRQTEQDVEDELRFHLEMEAQKNERAGLTSVEARRHAAMVFGGVEKYKEQMRDGRGTRGVEGTVQDISYAWRVLRSAPAFSVVAVLTLALGIGASSAMFTLVNGVLLRPLAYADPDRLVVIWEDPPEADEDRNVVSQGNFAEWRRQATVFESLAATADFPRTLTGAGEPAEIRVRATSANFFSLLGARAALGRTYVEGEPAEAVVVLSNDLWRRRFGSDASVIGRTITVNDLSRVVIGVMGPDFRSVGARPDVWYPVTFSEEPGRFLGVVGRLKPGRTVEDARIEMRTIAARTALDQPMYNKDWGTTVLPMREEVTGAVRPALLVLSGAVLFLLLIACANVANLLLARAASRGPELAVRVSLGASRGRLIRQLLTESLLLSAMAGALGFFLAWGGVRLLVALLPPEVALPRLDEIALDWRVAVFATGASLLTALLFGTAPALSAASVQPASMLRESMRGTTAGRRSQRVRSALVIGEVATALVLLVGAGLLGRSLQSLMSIDTGLDVDQVLTMRIVLGSARYGEDASVAAYTAEVNERLGALPGVRAAGSIAYLPLSGDKSATGFYRLDRPAPAEGDAPSADIRVVGGEYFKAMGIPLQRGRVFDARDRADAPVVYVINEALAREFYPGEDPIGKPLTFWWGDMVDGEVIGVVGDVTELGPAMPPSPAIYRPVAQMPYSYVNAVIRTDGDPTQLATAAVAAVRSLDPGVPVAEVQPLASVLGRLIARPRLNLFLFGVFAALALLLAATGLYGVIAYSVTQRRREIGVRLALGAATRDVMRLIVGQGLRVSLAGLAIGLAAALLLTRLMATLLFGVDPTDPPTLLAVSALLLVVATIASAIPAARAARLDPVRTLRE